MNKLYFHSLILALFINVVISLSYAFSAESGDSSAGAATSQVALDDGTTANGDIIIPEAMAMYCGLSSKEAVKIEKMQECMDKLAAADEDYNEIKRRSLYQLSKSALEQGMKIKSMAGDFEANQEKIISGDSDVQADSPSAGGEGKAEGKDISKDQNDNVKMNDQSSQNIINLYNVYAISSYLEYFNSTFDILIKDKMNKLDKGEKQ